MAFTVCGSFLRSESQAMVSFQPGLPGFRVFFDGADAEGAAVAADTGAGTVSSAVYLVLSFSY